MGIPSDSDRFTVMVIQEALAAAADEMFAVLRRAAMSPIIYEVLDVGTGITDAEGNLVSSGCGIPGFVAVLDKSVKRILELTPLEEIYAGDVFVTNDPYYGGVTHLNDVVLAMPVFADDTLIAWAANIGHWNDVGGAVPGSMSTEARDLFAEGLRLPAIKLIERGKPIQAVLRIMEVNSRAPDFLRGDLWASIASLRKGAERIASLAATYGHERFRSAILEYYDYAEAQARAGLGRLPKGRIEIAEPMDDGSVWHAAMEIGEEKFTLDLRDLPDQSPRPINASRDNALVVGQLFFKNITAPETVCNAGSFRPLQILTRPGSIFDPHEPAPQGYYFETRARLFDMLHRGIAEAMPEQMPAGHFASICATVIAGRHPDHGRWFTMVEPQVGGWGATAARDGINAQFSIGHGDTFNCPVEIAEARYGFAFRRLALNDEAGGRGIHDGGMGVVSEYAIRGKDSTLTAGYGRHRQPAWGLAGGEAGTTNRVEIERADGRRETHAIVSALPLAPGDVVRIVTARGGGWGRPKTLR
jgi:N-methylhydantoinase B